MLIAVEVKGAKSTDEACRLLDKLIQTSKVSPEVVTECPTECADIRSLEISPSKIAIL